MRELINSLKLVDYLLAQANKSWHNYHISLKFFEMALFISINYLYTQVAYLHGIIMLRSRNFTVDAKFYFISCHWYSVNFK